MIKMLAFDVDGTITAGNNEITPRLRAIFDQLEKKGLKLVLATGRPYEDLYPLKRKNNFFPATVLLNGAMVRDEKDNKIFAHYMSIDLVEAVCKILQQFDVPFVCFTKDKNVVYQSSKQTYGQVLGIYLPDSELEMHGLIDSLVSVEETDFNYEETLKIEALFEDISLVDQAREALKDVTGIDVVSSMNFNLEITPDYINKARALQEYVRYEEINEDEVMVFGDSENDRSMLEAFKHSVLVKNPNNDFKVNTKYIVRSCQEDGVAEFLENYFELRGKKA